MKVPFHIFERLHRSIEVLKEEGNAHAEDQSDHRAKHEVQGDIRADRAFGDYRRIVHQHRLGRHLAGNCFPHLLELHRLQKLLVGFEITLGIDIVLSIQAALDGLFASLILHGLDTLEAVGRKIELCGEGSTKIDHPLIELALHVLDLVIGGQHSRVLRAKSIDAKTVELAFALQILRVKVADDVVRQIQACRIDHQLITVVFQKAADLALKLALFLLKHVESLERRPCALVLVHAGLTVKRVGSLVDDPLGAHDRGQHFAALLNLVLLVSDRLVEFLKGIFRIAAFQLGPVLSVGSCHFLGNIPRINLVGVAHANRNQVGTANVLGVDDTLEDVESGFLVDAPAVHQLEVLHHLLKRIAALDFLKLGSEELLGHPTSSRKLVEL